MASAGGNPGVGVGGRVSSAAVLGVAGGFVGPPALSAVTARRHTVTPPRRSTPKPKENACPRWCRAVWRSCS